MTPDVNVLVAASRADHPHHTPARAWLKDALVAAELGTPLRIQPLVIVSFLRLVTHARIFVKPTPMDDALAFVDVLLSAQGVKHPTFGAEWPDFKALCAGKQLAANEVPDAWLAAAVLHQGEHLVSFDADIKKLLPRSRFTRLTT